LSYRPRMPNLRHYGNPLLVHFFLDTR